MLANTIEMLQKAKNEKYAVPHFNINNLEWTKYILEECNKNNSPVILGVSESAIKYMGGYDIVSSIVTSLIKDLIGSPLRFCGKEAHFRGSVPPVFPSIQIKTTGEPVVCSAPVRGPYLPAPEGASKFATALLLQAGRF